MRQEPKAGRQIVSRGAYVRAKAKYARKFLFAASLTFLGVICFVFDILCWDDPSFIAPYTNVSLLIALFLVCGIVGYLSIKQGLDALTKLEQIKVVPLTRANTADLPAPDSLVRASQEPAQAQEGVLLRAASGEAQAGQEGQLLRASVGGQE